ncbi:hypothetical protein AVEN_202570-1 [Araneus ventricosus]|uniref:Uncharacterized protein n=1 Tax=Araneus ventricosus TaxID=182803 RepID=A0A4Y2K438_ARAVE|nr:hypothetical protein AVEN_202570-1 [Araneus ventricosus]
MHPNDSRFDSSSAEARVLKNITGHGPIPPVGGTHYHRQRTSPSHCTHQGSETQFIYPAASQPRTRGAHQWDITNSETLLFIFEICMLQI